MTEWTKVDWFFAGLILGYIVYPLWNALGAILANAWNATSACNNECNQGRNCTCKKEKE